MNINLGTTSDDKFRILETIVKEKNISFSISRHAASSQISDQPISIGETTQGAINRSFNAYNQAQLCDIAIGLEGGLVLVNSIYHLICIAAIFDGKRYFVGASNLVELPKSVSDKVKDNKEFGIEIRNYQHSSDEAERISELISRESSFTQAINQAFTYYENA